MTVSLAELLSQRDALERKIQTEQSSKRQAAISEIRRLMAESGLSISDLGASVAPKSRSSTEPVKKVAPKYRDPNTGQTWTGRGLKPKWMSAAIAAGKSTLDFAI